MNPNNYKMNQMHIDELNRVSEMERMARAASNENSVIAAYLSAHLLAPLGRKLIQSGNSLLERSEPANQAERIGC